MYFPIESKSEGRALALTLMPGRPLARLFSDDGTGLPDVTQLRLHGEERSDAQVLLGHMARRDPPRPQPQSLQCAVVTFARLQARMLPERDLDRVHVQTSSGQAVHRTVRVADAAKNDRERWLVRLELHGC